MATSLLLGQLAEEMETCTVVQWLKRVGDAVQKGDALVEIETDKASMEVEAEVSGVLAAIHVVDGTENVTVGSRLATIAGDMDEYRGMAGGCKRRSKSAAGGGIKV